MMGWIIAAWWGFWATLATLFEDHKLARRFSLFWAMWLITDMAYRRSDPVLMASGNGMQPTEFIAIVGVLTTVIGFYQWSRGKDDEK